MVKGIQTVEARATRRHNAASRICETRRMESVGHNLVLVRTEYASLLNIRCRTISRHFEYAFPTLGARITCQVYENIARVLGREAIPCTFSFTPRTMSGGKSCQQLSQYVLRHGRTNAR